MNPLIRLHNVQGQLRGIEKMILSHRPPGDVKIQFSAAEHSLYELYYTKFFEAVQKNVAAHLSQLSDKYADRPRLLETIDTVRENFHTYNIKQLLSVHKLLCEIDDFEDKNKPE